MKLSGMADPTADYGGARGQAEETLAEARGVSKRFGGTLALDSVDVRLRAGQVHAFVGENGAGKSTLGKVIAGLYSPDSGEVLIRGRKVDRWDPARAQAAGVAMVAQELALAPQLTVAENVFLGQEEHRLGILRRSLMRRYQELDERVEFGLDPAALVGDLGIADQQKVEILRALARDAQLIVLDEPTSSLSATETERLHDLIRRLCRQGCAVVYVSHFLDAVLEISDHLTVLRDGAAVASYPNEEIGKDTVVESMLGRVLGDAYPDKPVASTERAAVLEVGGLSSASGVVDANLTIRPGEIVGLLGLVGSGRSEIARTIFGADVRTGGTVRFKGRDLPKGWKVRDAVAAGIGMVPESRHHEGLVLQRSVRENVSLASLGRCSASGVLLPGREKKAVEEQMTDLEMRPLKIELSAEGFSGGNQQKALLGKWLIGDPELIILDEPTRGVDVGAKRTIYHAIAEMAEAGMAVLLISSEHEEVLGLAHRAYLVSSGRTVHEVEPNSLTADEVVRTLFALEDLKDEELSV